MNGLLLLLIADLQGTVLTADRKPVAGAAVAVSRERTARTDGEGRFRFAALADGTYTLRAEMAGFAPYSARVKIAGADVRMDVTLTPAEFFDEPTFVVAGVTDTVNRGGHGSETTIRSTEALARATASLGTGVAAEPSEALRKRVAGDPENAALHHALAAAEEREGAALDAAREYQRAAELAPTEDHLFDWATDLLTHRAVEQAVEVFEKGQRLFPASARMLLGWGAALYARGAYDEAARRFFLATDLKPDDPAPYLFLGSIDNTEVARTEGFLARMERFARLFPGRADAQYLYATALWSNRDDNNGAPRVIELLRAALRLENMADAHLELGIVRADMEDFAEAIAELRAAIDLGCTRIEAHYRLSQAYQRVGESAEARRELDIYQRMRKSGAEQEERQRQQIRQFIFEMRKP